MHMADRRQKFVDIAERRVTKVIKDIQLVGNLANARSYKYDGSDVKKIFRALQSELDSAKARFELGSENDKVSFKL